MFSYRIEILFIYFFKNFTRLKDYGKTPEYIERILKEKETVRLAEVERIRAIKPPLRRLSKEELNDLLTVSGILRYYFYLKMFCPGKSLSPVSFVYIYIYILRQF